MLRSSVAPTHMAIARATKPIISMKTSRPTKDGVTPLRRREGGMDLIGHTTRGVLVTDGPKL